MSKKEQIAEKKEDIAALRLTLDSDKVTPVIKEKNRAIIKMLEAEIKELEEGEKTEEQEEEEKKKEKLAKRVKDIEDCAGSVDEVSKTLNEYKRSKQPKVERKEKRLSQVIAEGFASVIKRVAGREMSIEKVAKINTDKLERGVSKIKDALKDFREAFSGLSGDGFINEFEGEANEIIEKIKKKQEELETAEA